MVPAEKKGEWEPINIRERKTTKYKQDVAPHPTDGDTAMAGTDMMMKRAPSSRKILPPRKALYTLSERVDPPFHTPILVITQPAWTAQDHEIITQFFFEKFKTPAFCLMDSALAVCYAYGASTATVIDIGYEKCDITAVNDFLINDAGRGTALTGYGGRGSVGDPTAALRVAASGTDAGDEAQDGKGEDNEGVLDVATIVASGKTSEFLARKEKEKAEKAKKATAKKAAQEAANAPKPAKLPNAKQMTASFQYTERRPLEEINRNGKRPLQDSNENSEVAPKRPKTSEPQDLNETGASEPIPISNAQINGQQNGESTALIRRDVEVGVERFKP
ncbi:MAG: hypothetical protein LQ349_000803 [Xanthoria aureola]|nr:MAG: hypothetical protein LQ349_000803 [Xanthoria aureola]